LVSKALFVAGSLTNAIEDLTHTSNLYTVFGGVSYFFWHSRHTIKTPLADAAEQKFLFFLPQSYPPSQSLVGGALPLLVINPMKP